MSDFSTVAKLEEMKAVIAECEKEAARFDKGIKTGGTKVRKAMQQIKAIAQEIRSRVAEIKATMEPNAEKSERAKQRSVFCKKD